MGFALAAAMVAVLRVVFAGGCTKGSPHVDAAAGASVLYNIYDRSMWDLNDLLDSGNPLNTGWTVTQGEGINDSGWITGFGTYNGHTRAFLMKPVPEPSTRSRWGRRVVMQPMTGERPLDRGNPG